MATGGRDVSALGVGTMAAGAVLVWSGLRGSSVLSAVQDIIKGDRPKGVNVHQIQGQAGGAALASAGGSGSVLAMAQQVAASPAGRRNYCWNGGHSINPCSASCFDCSGYVSCVLGRLGLLKGAMNTLGFLTWKGAATVPYGQRQPGDLYVSASHIGIIADGTRMWNAACTACGPVKLSNYVGRSGYIVRRVKGATAPTTSTGTTPATSSGSKCLSKGWNNGVAPPQCLGGCRFNDKTGCWERL